MLLNSIYRQGFYYPLSKWIDHCVLFSQKIKNYEKYIHKLSPCHISTIWCLYSKIIFMYLKIDMNLSFHRIFFSVYWRSFFDSRMFMYNKIFLKKPLKKFVFHIFIFLLVHFASKLVNYSRRSETLNFAGYCTLLTGSTYRFNQNKPSGA